MEITTPNQIPLRKCQSWSLNTAGEGSSKSLGIWATPKAIMNIYLELLVYWQVFILYEICLSQICRPKRFTWTKHLTWLILNSSDPISLSIPFKITSIHQYSRASRLAIHSREAIIFVSNISLLISFWIWRRLDDLYEEEITLSAAMEGIDWSKSFRLGDSLIRKVSTRSSFSRIQAAISGREFKCGVFSNFSSRLISVGWSSS